MFERKQCRDECYHLENMTKLDLLPPDGFTRSLFPVKWGDTTGAPGRAVAVLGD